MNFVFSLIADSWAGLPTVHMVSQFPLLCVQLSHKTRCLSLGPCARGKRCALTLTRERGEGMVLEVPGGDSCVLSSFITP